MKKLLLITTLISSILFTSCGDSEEGVFNKYFQSSDGSSDRAAESYDLDTPQ